MRPVLAALALAYGLIGMADLALASVYGPSRIYVPGHIQDGIYIRPHFVSAPKLGYRVWPADRPIFEPKLEPAVPAPMPDKARDKLGEPS